MNYTHNHAKKTDLKSQDLKYLVLGIFVKVFEI
jgi:hypothetical protein